MALDTPGATFRMTGKAEVTFDDETINIRAVDGPITVAVLGGDGGRIYLHHPMVGWHLQADMRGGDDDQP